MAEGGLERGIADGARAPLDTRSGSASRYPAWKRTSDVVLATLASVLAVPLLLTIRIAMLAGGDSGPFLFRAGRVGEGGRSIEVLKIRTMAPGASGSALTTKDDDRVTRIGRVLRRYKLDELPQLWNVLRGEMALVGPRPEDPSFVDITDPVHQRVFTARPGITGLAQLEFRHEVDLLDGPDADRRYRESILPQKLKMDLDYLDRCSLALDIRIMARTVASIFASRQNLPAA